MCIRRSEDALARRLAERRAESCMLGLSELEKFWPVGGWILQVFVHVMRKLSSRPEASRLKRTQLRTNRESIDRAGSRLGADENVTENPPHQAAQGFASNTEEIPLWLNYLDEFDRLMSHGNSLNPELMIDPAEVGVLERDFLSSHHF